MPLSHVWVWLDQLITNPSLVWLIGSSPSISVSPVSTTKEAAAAGRCGVGGRASSTGKGKQRPVQDGDRLGRFVLDRFAWSERGAATMPFLQDSDCCGADVENPKQPRQAVLYLQESGLGELFSFHFFVVHFGLLKS